MPHRSTQPLAMLDPDDDYDDSFTFRHAMAPAIWLALAGGCMLVALYAVGYLAEPEPPQELPKLQWLQERIDAPARRATLAFSGIALGITIALSATCGYWAFSVFARAAASHRQRVLRSSAVLWVSAAVILAWRELAGAVPFTSELGWQLLKDSGLSGIGWPWVQYVPYVMFLLACVVPAVLAAGACGLLQPMRRPVSTVAAREQLHVIARRLKELDQLLYIGALTLVFGTVQLSTALSVPLTSVPRMADLKTQADVCKALAPASPASARSSDKAEARPGSLDIEPCRSLVPTLERTAELDSLRSLARGVTLSFGLAYSALLATIYVPGVLVLRHISRAPQDIVGEAGAPSGQDPSAALGEADPLRRLTAIVATLSPLITGILANAFGP